MKKLLAINWLRYIIGFLLVLLSLAVIVGWHTRSVLFFQITSHFPPVVYNATLAFFFLGIAILLIERFKKISGILGIIIFLIGFLTLLQYIFQINLKIDQLFIQDYVARAPHPGRMALNTAVGFSLLGVVFYLMGFHSKNYLATNISVILTLLVGVIGFVALFGYASGISTTYGWGSLTQMTPRIGIGFLLIIIAIIPSIWKKSKITLYRNNFFLSLMVLSMGMLLFFLFWQVLRDYEVKSMQKAIQNEGRFLDEKITALLERDIKSINGLFNRIRNNSYKSKNFLEEDINYYLSFVPALEIIGIKNGSNDFFLFKDEGITDTKAKNLLSQCDNAFLSNHNVGLEQNVQVVGLSNILCVRDRLTENTAVLNMQALMRPIVSSTFLQGYVLHITQESTTIYEYPKTKQSSPEYFKIEFPLSIFGMQWNTQIQPSKNLIKASRSWFPTIFLTFGFIITILLAIMVRLWQLDQLRKKSLKRYAKELKRSNRALDDFAYIASHDLKEPLRGINNFASFLLEDYENKLDEEGKEKLKVLQRLSQRMEALINSLLTYSRVGRLDLALKTCNINDKIQEKLHLLAPYLKEQNAEIKLMKPMPTILCDEARIGEVFQNLITNAVKYNDNEKKEVVIDFQEKRDHYLFSVKDNGIGIAKEHFDQVFKIFKRLHGRNEYGGGTGAGMTIIKKIIERHKGKIWLDSEVGKGTTVYFTISKSLKLNSSQEGKR